MEQVNVFNFRSLSRPVIGRGFFSNPWIIAAWLATVALQIAVIYHPWLQAALHTVPLGPGDWLVVVLATAPMLVVPEAVKRLRRPPADADQNPPSRMISSMGLRTRSR